MEIEDSNDEKRDFEFEEFFQLKLYDPVLFEDNEDIKLFDQENPTNNYLFDLLKDDENSLRDYMVSSSPNGKN